MNPAELRKAGFRLFGKHWQTRMAERFNVNPSTVRLWVSGSVKVPGPAAAAIRCWLREAN